MISKEGLAPSVTFRNHVYIGLERSFAIDVTGRVDMGHYQYYKEKIVAKSQQNLN